MFLKKTIVGANVVAAMVSFANSAAALPYDYEIGLQPAASPVMEQIENFHTLLLYIIVSICGFVLALLVWIILRYNGRTNPAPSRTQHNTAWLILDGAKGQPERRRSIVRALGGERDIVFLNGKRIDPVKPDKPFGGANRNWRIHKSELHGY